MPIFQQLVITLFVNLVLILSYLNQDFETVASFLVRAMELALEAQKTGGSKLVDFKKVAKEMTSVQVFDNILFTLRCIIVLVGQSL